ncbi:phage tail protein [Campylobacter sp. RM9328]|uniref:phage tail-collar fiber domain-containing protein n=1 Tax=Campylobacter sp. RM9328 TaxID=1705720 RepID=UPI001473078B|nr:phage tail protein [Campylobacter sp. RM9328]
MDYFSILTNAGLNKLIKATANNAQIVLTQMGVSDSTQPITQDLTELPSIKHKFSINTITQSESDANVLICEGVISADVGGFYIRRVGIYTDDGILFAVGVVPESYKPLLSEGSSKDITIKFYLQVDNAANITLKVDNNIVLATRSHVADEIKKLDKKFLPVDGTAVDSEKLGNIEASKYALKSDISDGLKIGSYLLWSSESTTPAGFLVCDGRSLNKIEYPELFNVIGYTYGGSEESFNIPNFSDGKFFRSVGGNANALGVVQEDELKSHSHNSYTIKGNHSSLGGNWYGFVSNNMTTPTTEVGGVETRPYNMSVVVLIKAKNVKEPNSGQIDNSIYATEAKAGITKLKNSITGNATDTAVTEKAVKSFLGESFDSSKSSNGYTKLPNGLILQWGITDPQNGFIAKPTMFPIAFTSECFGVWVTLEHSQASATTETVVRGHSTTGFLLTASVGVVTSARWLAIGY